MTRLDRRRAIVTAGASGIGRACVERFCAEGASVCFSDINREAGTALEHSLRQAGKQACFIEADMGDMQAVRGFIAAAQRTFGPADILLNNAGIAISKSFFDQTEDDFDRSINVNLKAAFLASQLVAREMVDNHLSGSIVNMSSINAVVNIPRLLPYNVTKGAINQLTRNLAVTLAPHGIRVNALGPGTIVTEMVRNTILVSEDARREVLSRTPLGRCGLPEEVASAALFLVSDESSYVTGHILYLDGGRLSLNYMVPVPER